MRLLVGVLALSAWAAPVCAETAPRWNVILILADDLGWADLGCYGSTYHRTPALDQLAASGIRFTEGYASCPVCSPTRAALMTGKVPARLGITDWLPGRGDRPDQQLARPLLVQQLPLEETTLAELFRRAGYATAHIGKWHLGGKGFDPTAQGFDQNIAGDHTGTPRSYFAPYRNKQGWMPGLEKASEGEYLTDRLTREAERFLDENKDRPFFLYLAHYAVHTPMRAKAELLKKYPGKLALGKQSNPIYAAMLESLDDSVRDVMARLRKLKLDERTLVVFTSDNGGLATREGLNTPATINSPLREGKGWLYEGGLRVPWIIRWLGVVQPGRVSSVPIITHDLLPTLVEACGLSHTGTVDGISLVSHLQGKDVPKRDTFYWHYPHYANQGGRPGGVVREGNWKLIEFYEDNRRELFDLRVDVRESRNRAADEPALVKRLAEKLEAWRKQVGAKMPRPNPDYRPNPQDERGVVTLHARSARVQGMQLRYEPLPHKETLGYWTEVNDQASWEFSLTRSGTFSIEILQGCGKGQGGSEVEIETGGSRVRFKVAETGGFQQFEPRTVGTVRLARPGRYTLIVRPRSKAHAAIMDLRQVVLRPVKE